MNALNDLLVRTTQAAVNLEAQRIDLPFNNLADVFGFLVNVVLGVGIAVTIIFLIIGGIQYITARGDQKAAGAARESLTNAVIGFVVVIGAFTIRLILLNVITGADKVNLKVNEVVNF
ncbi:pilin [Patescibacteria group bacterium]|nr:pilin [Patescibacteria group bacterium]MBU1970419.1 pilin [Patescibacteria group bacterium]